MQVRKANLSFKQAKEHFIQNFQPSNNDLPVIIEAMRQQYEKGIPTHKSAAIRKD